MHVEVLNYFEKITFLLYSVGPFGSKRDLVRLGVFWSASAAFLLDGIALSPGAPNGAHHNERAKECSLRGDQLVSSRLSWEKSPSLAD